MASLQQTKSRIRSVSSTKKITKAMELVATSKLKKAKDLHKALTPYKDEVFEIISYLAKNVEDKDYVFLNNGKTNKNLFIIINSSLGLCGSYNIEINKYAMSLVSKDDDLIIIGSKGISYFKQRGYNIIESYADLPNFSLKEKISNLITYTVVDDFKEGKYNKVEFIYSKFVNSLTYTPTNVTILPITNLVEAPILQKELLLEPSANEVLDDLIPFYVTTSIKALIFESMLSEQASRRTAMENATDNATELEDKLRLMYNKSRQAAITQEITEISAAANANK